LQYASYHKRVACTVQAIRIACGMPRRAQRPARSGCPLNAFLEVLGDPWALLVVRDLLFKEKRTYGEFARAGEGIATNILASRLQRLQDYGIVEAAPDPADARRAIYRLTEKGLDLAPALVEMILWGARHFSTDAPLSEVRRMKRDPKAYVAALRRRYAR
jgi:DNA-binding HxlR family transcriptional regulator